MKFITFEDSQGRRRAGWLNGERAVDMAAVSGGQLPADMRTFLAGQEVYMSMIKSHGWDRHPGTHELSEIRLLAPLPDPASVRDFSAFEQHVRNATARSNAPMPKEWYEVPVFYFSNHHAIIGPEADVKRPRKCAKLDYELEIAAVIGKQGRNIPAEEADQYIFGYTIMNDWSARDLQAQEMKVNLGPAKGKDFATSIGPVIVTKDELEPYRVNDRFDLRMTAAVNGRILSEGNFQDIYYTFGQMIARASEDVTLFPGDIIGSGTVGFGCLLELGPEVHRWLEPGDVVELEITGLGTLRNRIV